MKKSSLFLWIVPIFYFVVCLPIQGFSKPLNDTLKIRGWTLLSDDLESGDKVLDHIEEYKINHIQLSHHIIHDLRHVKDTARLKKIQYFIKKAHDKGVEEVVVWDRSLYNLDYYPDKFKIGPKKLINLDDPEFWEWFKEDYRKMLDLIPDIQGIVLTFIETGARVENQYSAKMRSNQEKLAAVVNAVASVVIEERNLKLYARTFSYTYAEYENIIGAIELFENPDIVLMMKETPHDFFLTHPNNPFPGKIERPTIIEFDACGEFNGQGIIANTWPEYIKERWMDFLNRKEVVGYVARVDRYGDTRIIGRPSEINLYALKRIAEDITVSTDSIYKEFIMRKYNSEAYPFIETAFKNSYDIITSILYTLGTSTANHSSLFYDPYNSHWARHVSGKWLDPPVIHVKHNVNKKFHYWKDIINHLAPPWAKKGGAHLNEIPWVIENNWIDGKELMNQEYLEFVVQEKEFGIRLAKESLLEIERTKDILTEVQFDELYHYFKRTLLTAQLHKSVAIIYYGYRVHGRGKDFQSQDLLQKINTALEELKIIANEIIEYPNKPSVGQWNWIKDAENALMYYDWVTNGKWPKKISGFDTGLDGVRIR